MHGIFVIVTLLDVNVWVACGKGKLPPGQPLSSKLKKCTAIKQAHLFRCTKKERCLQGSIYRENHHFRSRKSQTFCTHINHDFVFPGLFSLLEL